MLIAGVGLAIVAVTSTLTASYWWFALGLVVQALGMGITTAPSTGAIMRSLPLHKAGVGSAVNDTTRELGGALGVAVLGSLVASHFRSSIQRHGRRTAREGDALTRRGAAARGGGRWRARWCDRARGARRRSSTRSTRRCGSRVVVVIVASGIVAWLLRPTATAKVDAEVDAGRQRRTLEAA